MPEEITIQDSLSLRSEEVQEIIGRAPHWLIRWGITLFFLMLAMVLLLSWFIKYPDIITASFTLTSVNAPKSVNARAEGKLIKLFIKDNDTVRRGQLLGYIESTANVDQVLQIDRITDTLLQLLNNNKTESVTKFSPGHYNQLGELQADLQTFNQAFLQFKAYLSSGYYTAKKKILLQDLANLQQLQRNLLSQQVITRRDLELAQESYAIQETLAARKVIAPLSFKEEESKLLGKKMPLEQLKSSIISNESSQNDKQDELLELEKEISEQKITFLQALNTFRSRIAQWKYQYLLTSPISGKVRFISFLQENQTIQNGQELFYIEPDNIIYVGLMYVPQFNLGKISGGESVIIKFSSYPFEEYGSVSGRIKAISAVPKDSSYLVQVALPHGLRTNYDKTLSYREGMTASAEIVTANKRLVEKFIYNVRKTLNDRN